MDWETARRWLEIMAKNGFDPNQPAYIVVLQRVEELEVARELQHAESERWFQSYKAAEAKLARCVEALDRVLTEAGMQAHKHGCPERLRRPAKWDEHAPCAGCQAEAAKGGE